MTNAFLNVLTLLATISAPPRARAVSLYDRVACRLALATTFVPGEWIMVRSKRDMLPSRIVTITDRSRRVDVSYHQPNAESWGLPARRPTRRERAWIEKNLTVPFAEARARLGHLVASGGAGGLNPGDARQVIVARAPQKNLLTDSDDDELIFNHPDLVDGLIAYVTRYEGRFVLGLPVGSSVGGGGSVAAHHFDAYRKRRGQVEGVPFDFNVAAHTTRAMVAHELIHVEDIVVNPIPEFDLFAEVDGLPPSEAVERRKKVIGEVIRGTLEERACTLGDQPYNAATDAPAAIVGQFAKYRNDCRRALVLARLRMTPNAANLKAAVRAVWWPKWREPIVIITGFAIGLTVGLGVPYGVWVVFIDAH